MIVFLDTGVLGLISSPSNAGEAKECKEWLYRLLSRSAYMVTSDICDYEVRRSLHLASSTNPKIQGLKNLDALQQVIDFLPLTKSLMKQAAQLWAEARRQGLQTSDNKNIDADIIIAAHWKILKEEYPGRAVVITTTNVKHLERFTEAVEWKCINF